MPYDDPDPSDPQMLVGVVVPGQPETMRQMAEAFADEFARLGYSAPQILALFNEPFFSGAHAAIRALGEAAVHDIVAGAAARWPTVRILDAPPRREG